MATPFDEKSVALCDELGVNIIKLASSDLNDWILIEKVAAAKKPVIVSTGGSSLKDVDDLVRFFANRNIPLAINHCVSLYPSEDHELELNQIDFLRQRYPDNVIGFSTHEYRDWTNVDPDRLCQGRAYLRASHRHRRRRHCGIRVLQPARADRHLVQGLEKGSRNVRRAGHQQAADRSGARSTTWTDWCAASMRATTCRPAMRCRTTTCILAVPLQKGQISCRELMHGEVLLSAVAADAPIRIDDIDSPYAHNERLKALIYSRGL